MDNDMKQQDFSIDRSTKTSRISTWGAVILIVILIAAPWWAGRANMRLFGEIYSFIALASLWNLLAGYTGLVSVGQQAYVGFGGYMLFTLAMFFGLNPLMAIPIAGIISLIIALPIAPLLFRLKGSYFAIGTWVAAEVFRLGFAQVSALGGGSGTSLPASLVKNIASSRSLREMSVYWIALAIALGTVLLVIFIMRSKIGLALNAIRDSDSAAESLGVNINRIKLQIYALVAGMTGMVGAFIFLQKLRISPDAAFSVNDWTAYIIFIVVIGGLGTIEGPIIGTIIFFLLRGMLADLGTIYLLILGVFAIGVMLKMPKGIWGTFSNKTGIVLIPIRRNILFKQK